VGMNKCSGVDVGVSRHFAGRKEILECKRVTAVKGMLERVERWLPGVVPALSYMIVGLGQWWYGKLGVVGAGRDHSKGRWS
jgi:hypothetical protein